MNSACGYARSVKEHSPPGEQISSSDPSPVQFSSVTTVALVSPSETPHVDSQFLIYEDHSHRNWNMVAHAQRSPVDVPINRFDRGGVGTNREILLSTITTVHWDTKYTVTCIVLDRL